MEPWLNKTLAEQGAYFLHLAEEKNKILSTTKRIGRTGDGQGRVWTLWMQGDSRVIITRRKVDGMYIDRISNHPYIYFK